MALSDLRQLTYDTHGFLIVRDFLSAAEVQSLREAVTAMKASESGEADALKHTGRVIGMFHKDARLLALFDDPRLHAIARQLLRCDAGGAPARFFGDEYVSYSTPADWHPDIGPDEACDALKFGFYLDDLSRGGCLRVVPGSHHAGFSRSVGKFRADTQNKIDLETALPCMTRPGDLLIFNLKLWHQGTANPPGTHRRVIFWSVAADGEAARSYARNFHDKEGRGKDDEPWPGIILRDAPRRRVEMLDVYPAGTVKHEALVNPGR